MQADGEETEDVGVSERFGERVRVPDGASDLCSGGHLGVVPLRDRIPNTPPLQPGLQQRAPDPEAVCWWEEGQVIYLSIYLHPCMDIFRYTNMHACMHAYSFSMNNAPLILYYQNPGKKE